MINAKEGLRFKLSPLRGEKTVFKIERIINEIVIISWGLPKQRTEYNLLVVEAYLNNGVWFKTEEI